MITCRFFPAAERSLATSGIESDEHLDRSGPWPPIVVGRCGCQPDAQPPVGVQGTLLGLDWPDLSSEHKTRLLAELQA